MKTSKQNPELSAGSQKLSFSSSQLQCASIPFILPLTLFTNKAGFTGDGLMIFHN